MRHSFLLLLLLLATYTCSRGQQVMSYSNDGFTLFYEVFGTGPALYILSGGPGEAPEHPYRMITDSLKKDYTCILLHQRGAGLSRNIPINEKTITIQNYTDDIEVLRSLRGDTSITLLGVSWGGLLAMNYAVHYPARVNDLILVCSAPPSYTVWNVLYDNQYARRSQAELDSMAMLQPIFSTKTEKELDSLKRANPTCKEVLAYKGFIHLHVRAMYYDKRNISKPYVDELFYHFNFQPIPLIDQEVLNTRWDITPQLRKLNTRALIIYGRQDDQGESTFYLQHQNLRHSEMHVIEQCGHEILEEQPAAFFTILMDYVRRARR